MRKTVNRERIEGLLYEHNLVVKQVKNEQSANYGKDFISGTIDIATSDDLMNIVQIHFTYVAEGGNNRSYSVLKDIFDGNHKCVVKDGPEQATKLRVDTALDLNDFYSNRNGKEELVSAKRNEGGFVSVIQNLEEDEAKRSTFNLDILINGTTLVEANPERGIEEDYLIVRGAVFDFRGRMLPTDFRVRSRGGINYFESLEASPKKLVFTRVQGQIRSVVTKTRVEEESAFGDPIIKEYLNTSREWLIDWAAPEPYVIDSVADEDVDLTFAEIEEKQHNRELDLADIKKRNEEYRASRTTGAIPAAKPNIAGASAAAGGFNF